MLAKVTYLVGGQYGLQQILVEVDGDTITVIDAEGEILIEHARPAAGITYVGNGHPRGRRPKTAEASPKS